MNVRRYKCLLLMLLLGYSSTGGGHNYSFSSAQVMKNPRSGHLEIQIQVFNHDLEPVLRKLCAEEQSSKIECDHEQRIEDELRNSFRIKDGRKLVPWEYVGREVGLKQSIIYLEVKEKFSLRELKFEFEFLKRYIPRQVNQLTVNI